MGWFEDYWNYYPREDKAAEQYAKELLAECRSTKTDEEILAAIAKIKSDNKSSLFNVWRAQTKVYELRRA